MKKLLLYSCLGLLLFSCTENKTSTGSTEKVQSKDTLKYPYTATYSSQFEMGNNDYAKTILDLWKDYDNNELTKGSANFADTVTIFLANGMVLQGPKDSVIAKVQVARSRFDSVRSIVDVWLPLHSIDKNDHWVCVWGLEIDNKNGKKDSTSLNENWRFNKNGKIDYMSQYAATGGK